MGPGSTTGFGKFAYPLFFPPLSVFSLANVVWCGTCGYALRNRVSKPSAGTKLMAGPLDRNSRSTVMIRCPFCELSWRSPLPDDM